MAGVAVTPAGLRAFVEQAKHRDETPWLTSDDYFRDALSLLTDAAAQLETLEWLANEVLETAQDFDDDEARGGGGTPGGVEHTGDFQSLIYEWRKKIIANKETT